MPLTTSRPVAPILLIARPHATRQLDAGETLAFWRDRSDGDGREGLVCALATCHEPRCDCSDVVIEARRVDEFFVAATACKDGADLIGAPSAVFDADPVAVVRLDCETGAVEYVKDSPRTDAAAAVLAWIEAEVDGELLEAIWRTRQFLRDEFVAPLAATRRNLDERRMLASAAYEYARRDCYLLQGRRYVVDEDVRLAADGEASVVLVFHARPKRAPALEVGTLALRSTATGVAAGASTGDAALVARLWRAYEERHDVPQRLRQAVSDVRRALAQARTGTPRPEPAPVRPPAPPPPAPARARPPAPPPPAPARARPPFLLPPAPVPLPARNAPCPCGSQLKFKRCHGAPA